MAYVEDFFLIIHETHATSKGHIGTLEEVGKLYDCAPRSAIDKYVSFVPCVPYEKATDNQSPIEAHCVIRIYDKRTGICLVMVACIHCGNDYQFSV